MEWLLREEVALLLATLVACSLLVLGTLELIWPTRPRPRRRAGGGTPPAERGPATPTEPLPARPPALSPADERAAVALRIGRALLERAQEEPDPASDRRARLICRAVACLTRGLEAAPGDAKLRETLAAAHDALATTDQQLAFRWLAVALPWQPADRRWAGAVSRVGG